jgi:hypothetical protein
MSIEEGRRSLRAISPIRVLDGRLQIGTLKRRSRFIGKNPPLIGIPKRPPDRGCLIRVSVTFSFTLPLALSRPQTTRPTFRPHGRVDIRGCRRSNQITASVFIVRRVSRDARRYCSSASSERPLGTLLAYSERRRLRRGQRWRLPLIQTPATGIFSRIFGTRWLEFGFRNGRERGAPSSSRRCGLSSCSPTSPRPKTEQTKKTTCRRERRRARPTAHLGPE